MTSLMLLSDVLDRLRISRTTFYELRRAGNFPRPVKIGRKLRWRVEEVESWLIRQ